jgi:hypothetical protein
MALLPWAVCGRARAEDNRISSLRMRSRSSGVPWYINTCKAIEVSEVVLAGSSGYSTHGDVGSELAELGHPVGENRERADDQERSGGTFLTQVS